MGYHFREHHNFTQVLEITPSIRKQVEGTIQMLVDLLDRLDPDPDLEDGGDLEHTLGWTDVNQVTTSRVRWTVNDAQCGDELEHDLGWTTTGAVAKQMMWANPNDEHIDDTF